MNIDISALGITEDKLVDLVVDRLASEFYDTDGFASDAAESIRTKLRNCVREAIDERVERIASEHVIPRVAAMCDNFVLQETNTWGEPKGGPVSFTEYMVSRAEAWLAEPVNHLGKTKAEGGYNWKKNTTRACYLVDRHLQYHIEKAMKAALSDANSAIVGGLEEAIKISLASVRQKLNVTVRAT